LANIGAELAAARKRHGLTQGDLAKSLGLTQARVSQIERGQDTRFDTIESYARALGYDLLLVPQADLGRIRSLLREHTPSTDTEERPSLFPSLADLLAVERDGAG
jgi:transcriptional regulator with XRE-family HTH domain